MCRYYFYGEGSTVEDVLNNANLVNISAIKDQIEDSKGQVVAGLTGDFTWV